MKRARYILPLIALAGLGACGPDNGYYANADYNNGYNNGYYTPAYGWNDEDVYWQQNYASRPYYHRGYDYNYYQPAYYFGVDVYNRHPGTRFEQINDRELRSEWERNHHDIDWAHARPAVRDSYNHMWQHDSHNGGGHNWQGGDQHSQAHDWHPGGWDNDRH